MAKSNAWNALPIVQSPSAWALRAKLAAKVVIFILF
jgi:hypothetical protein